MGSIIRIYKSFQEACKLEVNINVTFSAGIAEFLPWEMCELDVNAIISEADNNLYLSKNRGKNMITVNGVSIDFLGN